MITDEYKIAQKFNSQFMNTKLIIAGPCSFDNYAELLATAKELKAIGIEYLRAGAFKPRTSPYSFQGLRDDGIKMLIKVKKETGIKIVTELFSIEQVKKYQKDIDIIQVGSRNMYNYDYLKYLGTIKKPILLKRGLSATIEEWLNSAEYIAKGGNTNIILCERGIRSFDKETRNVLDLQGALVAKSMCNLPVIIDPSHSSGRSDLVTPMSIASLSCGLDGLIIEVDKNIDNCPSDKEQTLSTDEFKKLLNSLKEKNLL